MDPISQSNRPIAALLVGMGVPVIFYFQIKPNEWHYEIPSRSNVHQALGGAWVDDFGVGLKQLTISGVSGWGGKPLPGELWFLQFRELIYETYFIRRRLAANMGVDPDTVALYMADALNVVVCRVHPVEFHHERSVTPSPLLHNYRLQFAVIQELGILPAFLKQLWVH